MIIYKDVCMDGNGDELLSDVYDRKEVDDIVWEVEAKMVSLKSENDFDIGANNEKFDLGGGATKDDDEGGAGDALESSSRTVNNIVDAFRLVETNFDKKSYMTYIKGYMKKLAGVLKEKKPDRVDAFQSAAQTFVKKVLGEFSEYQFFTGESMDPEGMIVLCKWRDETPVMYYFKDGLSEMKV